MDEVQAPEISVVADPAKRFYLFEYDGHYPCGGQDDCTGEFATLELASAAIQRTETGHIRYECFDILDSWTGDWH